MNFEQTSEGQVMLTKCFRAGCTNMFQFEQGSPNGHYCSESCMRRGEQATQNIVGDLAWKWDMRNVDEFGGRRGQADGDVPANRQQG